ncbi:MAG TPA: 1,4-dihydroxy-6-naphthoate synthase [Chitinophagaceae bacterium]|nr:1,4-dihydroxy-6-naphthoate synthase [Chitinophagaceae bacterium]
MKLTLGFSPCPNDTFIFDAMVNGLIDTKGLRFDYVMEDVETLNEMALQGRLDITKLSYGTYLNLSAPYALLHAGSALGKGVGPLLVSRNPLDFKDIGNCRIAIPGAKTTANLLLSMAAPAATNKTELLFSEIEQAVLDGRFDAGLIIHEGRFTYAAKGLHKVADLGDWWENEMKAAIPLGGIVMKRSFERSLIAQVDALISESVRYSWNTYPVLSDFVTNNAQEMEEAVMRQHIQLYVNEFTSELGSTGVYSIETLFAKAKEAGLLNEAALSPNIFY